MDVMDILVTTSPKSIELGNGWGMSPANSERRARVLTRIVKSRRYVGDKIEEEFRFGAFVNRYDSCGLVEIEITDKRSVRKVVRQVRKLVQTHKDSCHPAEADLSTDARVTM
jgi:hypothetical protein